MPLAGAVVADSYWGRYRTMVVSCAVGVAVRYLIHSLHQSTITPKSASRRPNHDWYTILGRACSWQLSRRTCHC
jgi:hypothetical protein